MRPRLAGTALAVLLLAACAATPSRRVDVPPLADAAFRLEGRLSARHGADAVSANFRWDHDPPRDELALITPLGQTVAQLSGDTSVPFARVEGGDGRRVEAADWADLTRRTLGFPLPVTGLAAWIRGAPHAGSAFAAETDPAGRPILIRQDGWEVTLDYPEGEARAPTRLRLVYPDVEVRLVVDARR